MNQNARSPREDESELQHFATLFASIPKEKLNLQLPVITTPLVWLAIVGNLQLALRHPNNTGASSSHVKQFAAQVLRQFAAQVLRHLQVECGVPEELISRAFGDFELAPINGKAGNCGD
jgi:hypothetical protein